MKNLKKHSARTRSPHLSPKAPEPLYSANAMRRAGQKLARYWKAIEARTLTALRSKVASKTAAGWQPDGLPVRVTNYTKRRATESMWFSQDMVIAP